MKKLFAIIAVAMASVMVANAQIGIIGGVTTSSTTIDTENFEKNLENVNLYHVGIAAKLPLPLGFAIQPELLYQMKGADLKETYDALGTGTEVQTSEFSTKDGFIEFGLGAQWGIDLVALRPFVFAKPFIGYKLTGDEDYSNLGTEVIKNGTDETYEKYLADAKTNLEYGYSIGAGIELLEHFQLSLEYFKNLGKMFEEDKFDADKAKEAVLANYKDIESYGGIKVTLGFFF